MRTNSECSPGVAAAASAAGTTAAATGNCKRDHKKCNQIRTSYHTTEPSARERISELRQHGSSTSIHHEPGVRKTNFRWIDDGGER